MRTKLDIKKTLRLWSKRTKQKIERKIVQTGTVDTGDLLRSISYDQPKYSGNTKSWYVDFNMLDYGKYTDLDNPRVKKKPRPPRNFFYQLIEDETESLENMLSKDIELIITDTLIKNKK